MRPAIAIAALLAVGVAIALIVVASDDGGKKGPGPEVPGQPQVEVISPRNGSRQSNRAVVVKITVRNFHLAPRHFAQAPQLGEGNIRFSLNRVPDCVDPKKLQRAINSPLSSGRLIGRSFDYPPYSGPNGVLAEEVGSAGLYSPATRPEIFYHGLPAGFYRLVITLVQNNGAATPFHAVTNFEILENPSHPGPHTAEECKGKVSSAEAAKAIR